MAISSSSDQQKTEKTNFQVLLIDNLKQEIESARRLDPEKLAFEIGKIGFSCLHCGKCCRQAFGDNRVMLIPAEIEKIMEFTGLSKLELAAPYMPEPHPETSQYDETGEREDITEDNIHVFGWALRRKSIGDCIFYEKSTCRCSIYPVRPMLCETYPFYLEELKLCTCECEGLGNPISPEDSRKLAEKLLHRYVSELEDVLAVYENYVDFRRSDHSPEHAKENLKKGGHIYVVHDSTGITIIME